MGVSSNGATPKSSIKKMGLIFPHIINHPAIGVPPWPWKPPYGSSDWDIEAWIHINGANCLSLRLWWLFRNLFTLGLGLRNGTNYWIVKRTRITNQQVLEQKLSRLWKHYMCYGQKLDTPISEDGHQSINRGFYLPQDFQYGWLWTRYPSAI